MKKQWTLILLNMLLLCGSVLANPRIGTLWRESLVNRSDLSFAE